MTEPEAEPESETETETEATRTVRPSVTSLVRRHLWSSPTRTMAEVSRAQRVGYERAVVIVRLFYAVSTIWLVQLISGWPSLLDLRTIDAQWPAGWVNSFGTHRGILLILVCHLAATIAVLALPQRRLARILYSVFLLEYMAISNGFGKINHSLHGWFWVSVVLILLPDGHWHARTRVRDRHWFLTVIWSAQFVVLFFYMLTGVWKVGIALHQLVLGRYSAFHPAAFSYIVANRVQQTGTDAVLGHFFTVHPLPGWFLFTGTMYLESASVLIAFRPRLHRAWGVLLVLFHIGTQLGMGISFNQNIALVTLLFIASPFAPEPINWREVPGDLPGIKLLLSCVRWLRNRH